jgi:polyisoprenoid-binding protein YceI
MNRSVSRPVFIIGILVALAVGAGAGILGYVYLIGGSGEASRQPRAATLSSPTDAPSATSEPDSTDSATDTGSETEVSASIQTFSIVPEESQVLFLLDEDLMGSRNTVIGTTDQVAGNILVNFDNPSESMVGPIEINLRTLATDNEFRNRALRDQILESNRDEYEFTTFTPTAISGLPDEVEIGDTFRFTLTGDLPLRAVTNTLDWEVEVTIVSETRIEGRARTTITRTQYDLIIPTVPTVANVEEEIDLAIEFVAVTEQ